MNLWIFCHKHNPKIEKLSLLFVEKPRPVQIHDGLSQPFYLPVTYFIYFENSVSLATFSQKRTDGIVGETENNLNKILFEK